jgi:predicted ATPase
VGDPEVLNNLPAQVSSFVGRGAELAEVRRLVGGSRLVTLTGAGGAGKTRLALQVAAGLAGGSGEGGWFADLAPLGDPDLVAVTVAVVLGVREEPGRPAAEADLPRAFRTADLRLIHAAICCSRYSLWTCCGLRY